MSLISNFVVGSFTLDDMVLPDGRTMFCVSGGNALYAAIGARIWKKDIGLITRVSSSYPESNLKLLQIYDLDIKGVHRIGKDDIRLWILYEGERSRQILYRLDSGSIDNLSPRQTDLPEEYTFSQCAHMCGIPLRYQMEWAENLNSLKIPFSTDLIPIPQLFNQPEIASVRNFTFLRNIPIFLPSIEEVRAIWGAIPLLPLLKTISAHGPKIVAVKMGSKGSVVYDSTSDRFYKIPIIPVEVVDTTGAGDAYCGGFMVGISESKDALEASLKATVSASFVVEGYGALHALNAKTEIAHQRLKQLRESIIEIKESDPIDRE